MDYTSQMLMRMGSSCEVIRAGTTQSQVLLPCVEQEKVTCSAVVDMMTGAVCKKKAEGILRLELLREALRSRKDLHACRLIGGVLVLQQRGVDAQEVDARALVVVLAHELSGGDEAAAGRDARLSVRHSHTFSQVAGGLDDEDV
eukprot:CAMPEP_0195573268 /NCGR_PEP_ID=MMETSP0814-20130614/5235_1 /TAXON_ID=97485 /ORGANISM="Prymnesium parvum, Strain Texoma1" /LENGTH=143 /DNA_ID=CAMNT_0040709131 /DNA_START=169 /DNA_END=601 /DNA_ORIENTATION=-